MNMDVKILMYDAKNYDKESFNIALKNYEGVTIDYLDNNELLVRYNNVKSVTPGQACVFYIGDKCIGGGIIKEVRRNNKKLWYLL